MNSSKIHIPASWTTGIAILVTLALLIWATFRTVSEWQNQRAEKRTFDQLTQNYNVNQNHYRLTAGRIESEVNELHLTFLQYATTGSADERSRFDSRCRSLQTWLENEKRFFQSEKVVRFTKYYSWSGAPENFITKLQETLERYRVAVASSAGIFGPATPGSRRIEVLQNVNQAESQLLLLAGQARAFGSSVQTLGSPPAPRLSTFLYPVIIAALLWLVAITSWFALVLAKRKIAILGKRVSESESTLERQQKLAHKGQAAAELAHEIRNPLTAINIRLYTLQKTLGDAKSTHQDAKVIQREIRRLNAILEDFLHLDRPQEPYFISLSADSILAEARDLMTPQLARLGVELHLEPSSPAQVRADPHQLQQVLINLIKNGAESITTPPGNVTLRSHTGKATLRGKTTDAIFFEVQDTGVGIPLELQTRLFEPFFTTKKGGTGLGLAVSERIIEKHGGMLDFDSEINHGTTFRVVLPIETPPA